MESEKVKLVSGDLALSDPKDDRLGYAPFAEHLADSICRMFTPEGMVVAIYGSWGLGKTTVLNFVQHYLQEKPEKERPEIIRFNPWWFSGREDLVRDFFGQLVLLFEKHRVMAHAVREKLADLADFITAVPVTPYAQALGPLAKLLRPKQKDVSELKEHIADALRKQKKRILVVIDDIDRLTAEEIRQLFRVIKAVADFPNVLYLLAFDKEVVVNALKNEQSGFGEAYLEKIVQVPFELPLPDRLLLRQLLFDRLNHILGDVPPALFDQTHFGNVYIEGVEPFIKTPRDVVRLTNTLSVTYSAVKGEVNAIDFIAIETLRVFCFKAYDAIRENPQEFTGHSDTDSLGNADMSAFESFHNKWLEGIPEKHRETVKKLVVRIFPKLQAIWGAMRMHYGADSESRWQRACRICSAEKFPRYFRLSIPAGSFSDAEMNAILALAPDAKAFGDRLVALSKQKRPDGTTRVSAFLETLEDYTEKDIPPDAIPSILGALYDIGDQLLCEEDEPRGTIGFDNSIRIGRIAWQLLRRLEQSERFVVLKDAIKSGRAISTIVDELSSFGQQHGKYGGKERGASEETLMSVEHLEELEMLALDKVRQAAQEGLLLQLPGLPRILYRWGNWANRDEVKQWVGRVVQDDVGLIAFLEKFLQKTYSQTITDAVGTMRYRLDPKWVEPFLKPDEIIDRARKLAEGTDLTGRRKTALAQFVLEYDKRQQGKDPSREL